MRLKIFGERNTGTQFVRKILQTNGHVDLWPGTIAELGERDRVQAAERVDGPAADALLLREALIDDIFAGAFERSLGWKHAAPDLERMRSAAGDTVFLVTVKNPYAWVTSMFRRPHHNLLTGNLASIEAFVTSPWLCCGRDNAGRRLASPVELWNVKYRAWLALAEAHRTAVIRYEDLLLRSETLEPLQRLVEPEPREPWTVPSSVPNNVEDLGYYRTFYAQERWRDWLSPRCIAEIGDRLDRGLLDRLGYGPP